MFRRSRAVSFRPVPYQRARSGWRVPRSLLALLTGTALGAGGLLYLQERYLPPTLTAEASQQLIADLTEAQRQRQRIAADLEQTTGQLQAARADLTRVTGELAATSERLAQLQREVPLIFDVLPPDPRGGPIGIRAARFETDSARLSYDVLFSDDRSPRQPFDGLMQLVVAGRKASGGQDTVAFDPVPLSIDAYKHLKGEVSLPDGFLPRQATIRVLEHAGAGTLSLRIYNVR